MTHLLTFTQNLLLAKPKSCNKHLLFLQQRTPLKNFVLTALSNQNHSMQETVLTFLSSLPVANNLVGSHWEHLLKVWHQQQTQSFPSWHRVGLCIEIVEANLVAWI